MEREILFRGKRVDNGEWVEGDGIQYPKSIKLKGTCWVGGMQSMNDWAQVIPETVGQYTGLTDKNGRRIFEGDIIEYEEKFGIARYSVVWNGKAACFSAAGYEGMIIGDFAFYASNKCEVISNIHDNPELMGGEEK